MLLLAAILRTWVAVTSTHVPVEDESGYDETGWAIASGEGYVINGKWTYKAPLYSAFLAGVYTVTENRSHRAARVVQAMLGATLCLWVVWLGEMAFSRQVGLLAGWITAAYPAFIVSAQLLRSENLFVWFTTAACALWVWTGRTPEENSVPRGSHAFARPANNSLWLRGSVPRGSQALARPAWKSATVGVAAGLAALTRAAALGLPVVLAAATLMLWRAESLKKRITHAVLIVACAAAVIAPWTIRNWMRVGEFVPISTEGGRAFYVSWVSIPDGKRLGFGILDEDEQIRAKIAELSEVEAERFLYATTFAYIKENPREVIRLTVLKTLFFLSPFEWELMSSGDAVYNGAYVALVPFLVVFLFKGLMPASSYVYGLMLVIGYFAVVSIVYCGLPRYRFPIEPLLILAAASGVVLALQHLQRFARTRAAAFAMVVWAAINLAAMPFSSEIKPMARALAEMAGVW